MPSRPSADPATASSLLDADWLSLCRRVIERQREVFAEQPGIGDRTVYAGLGEGGDRALVIDRSCEEIVFAELDALRAAGHEFTAVSEERGEVSFGSGQGGHVVIDPIDGSLNARRTLPSHSFSLAVATGSTMADVGFGYVFDFGSGEEFTANRGGGAFLNGQRVEGPPGAGIEVLGLEAAEPGWMLPALGVLRDHVYRLRVVGSVAISLAYLAPRRFDAMMTARPCRSVDAAAGQLIAREAGALLSFDGAEPELAALGLDARFHVAAGWDAEDVAVLLAAQQAIDREGSS
jgi:myo-inositol-1(or 4)-monophosphatase